MLLRISMLASVSAAAFTASLFAAAQTVPNANANALLQPFSGLANQPGVLTSKRRRTARPTRRG